MTFHSEIFKDQINFRPNVGCIFLRKSDGFVLVGQRPSTAQWQFPQGGYDYNEDRTVEDTLRREMREELGVFSFDIVKTMPRTVKYFFPANLQQSYPSLHPSLSGRGLDSEGNSVYYKGQEQVWFLCSLDGHPEPSLELATEKEFSILKWVSPIEAYNSIVEFKKAIYGEVLKEFNLL